MFERFREVSYDKVAQKLRLKNERGHKEDIDLSSNGTSPAITSQVAASGAFDATGHAKPNGDELIALITGTAGNPAAIVVGDQLTISEDDADWGSTIIRTTEDCWLLVEAGFDFGVAAAEATPDNAKVALQIKVFGEDYSTASGEAFWNPSQAIVGPALDSYRDGSSLFTSRLVAAPANAFVSIQATVANLADAASGIRWGTLRASVVPFGAILGWAS